MKQWIITGLLGVALALLIAGTAVNQWGTASPGGYKTGLWANCADAGGCSTFTQSAIGKCAKGDTTGYGANDVLPPCPPTSTNDVQVCCQKWLATEAFLILAILILSVAVILSIIAALGKGDSLVMAVVGLAIVSFVFTLIGFGIGTAVMKQIVDYFNSNGFTAKLDAGVGLTAVAWILQLIAIGVHFGMSSGTKQ